MTLRSGLFLLLLLCPFRTSLAQTPPEDLGQPAADVLSTFGYELDLDKISIEIGTKRQANKDLRAQSEAIRDAVQIETLVLWMNGFDIWGPGALRGMLEQSLAGYAASVLAYYMPGENRLVVMDISAQPLAGVLPPEAVVAHELVHAWRDKHSGLMKLFTEPRPTAEALNIRWCLSEGEAQFAMMAWMMQDQGITVEELVSLDEWGLESPLLSLTGAEHAAIPYVYGARFMGKRWEQDGWDGVRGIWENRPTSTEQVLHPRKYRADEPQVVTLPEWPADLPAAERVSTECLGEMEILSMLRAARVDAHEARIAAGGWDGDRLDRYLTESGESALLWRSVWDRELDARQFYEQVGGRGDGEWRLDGRVVDWVRTQEGKLAGVLLEAMSALPHILDGNPEDAISTAALEQEWIADRQLDSFTLEDQVVYPRYDLSLPVPEGWTVQEFRGIHVMHPDLGSGEGFAVIVHEVARYSGMSLEGELEKTLRQLARMGLEVLESDIRQIGGREAGWIRHAGDTAGRAYGWVSIHMDGDRQVLVSLYGQNPELERVEPFVDQVFGGLAFGVESLERPEEGPEEDDYSSKLDEAPEPINHFTLRVIDGLTGEVCPNQEVWIASSMAVSEVRGALNESQVLERGRRFETDSSGSVQIPFRYFAQKVAARKGDSFSFSSIYPDHGDEETLRIMPQSNLVVRVVDQDGKPLRNVPVAIMEEREWSSRLIDEKVTRTRRGEVTWDNVFSQLANRENNKQYSVTFAFPTRNAKGIPIHPGDDFSEPIVLTLPETGSVVLRIDPEDVKGDEFVEYYPSLPDKAMYLPRIEVLGAATGPSYGHIDTRADGEFRKEPYTWVFPFVEVGLELSVVPAYEREPLLISGPTSAGDRVVVPLKVDQIGKKVISYGGWAGTEGDSHWVVHWEGRTSSTIEVTGRCLDADGQPMANTVMDWTVRRGPADKRESHSNTQVTTEADGSFRTRIFLDPGDDYNLRIQLIAVEDINASQVWSASWKGSDPPDPLSLGDLRPHPDARPFIPHFSIFVQDEAGEPIEGANCTLTSEIGNDPLRPLERGEIHRATSFRTSSTVEATNALGKVAIQWRGIHEAERGISLDECTDYVTVRASGYGDSTRQKIEHGARRVTITLKSFSNSGELSGSILLPDGFMVGELVGHELPAIWIESVDNPGQSIGQVKYRFSEDAMNFAVDDLPTGKYHLYMRVARAVVGWREDPFAPAPTVYELSYAGEDDPAAIEFEIAEGVRPSLEPIDLRKTLHVIVLRVTNEEGHTPKDGYFVNVLGRPWMLDSGDLNRPELGTRVVSFGPAVDITITSRGFRQQRLDQVTGNRDIVLQPDLKIRLELAREVKFPDDSYSFRVCLKPLPVSGAKLRLNRTRRQRLGSGGLQVIVGGPGSWEVEWELTRIVGGQMRTFRIQDKLAAGPILIEESSAGATILLTPPSTEMIEKALDELK